MAGTRPSVVATPPSALVVILRLIVAVLAYQSVLGILFAIIYALGLLVAGTQSWAFSMVGLALAEGGALASVLFVWHVLDRRLIISIGLRRNRLVKQWLRGALVGALMMVSVVIGWYVLAAGAVISPNPDPSSATLAVTLGFIGFLVQGPSEEVLFRGYLLENIRAKWGITWGVGISAIAFSLLHAANPGFGALPFINLFLFGVATGLWKLRIDRGQLWGVFAIHTVWNWLQQVVFGLPNSGTASPPQDTLFSTQLSSSLPGPIWGGGFGPEGTLGATIVLLAVIAATWRVGKKRA